MNCRKAQKWIALYRKGELTEGIQKKLREHLAKCESCHKIYLDYKEGDLLIAQIRSSYTGPDDELKITDRILNTIAGIEEDRNETGIMSVLDRFYNLLLLPATRRIIITCLLLIIITFGYQQYYVYSRIISLEKQLSVAGKAGLTTTETQDLTACIRKSARYLSGLNPEQKRIEKSLRKDIRDNPEKLDRYISLICGHHYNYLKKTLLREEIIIPDFVFSTKTQNNP